MKKFRFLTMPLLAALPLVFSVSATHALEPGPKCQAAKLKEAGKYGSCRLKAESKAVRKGEAPDYTKCTEKFSKKWLATEAKAGPGLCPSESDEASMDTRIIGHANAVSTALSGLRFEDCSDGTVVDHQTGLMWQKSDDLGSLTDKDNTYTWTTGTDQPDGTAFLTFLRGLNDCESSDGATVTGGYAGHCDWRMPQADELVTILDCSFGFPCIDEPTFGPTADSDYWSATSDSTMPTLAWFVDFGGPSLATESKDFASHVRAVRTGSCP